MFHLFLWINRYRVQVRVEDESDSVTLMAIGKGGEYLFGKSCKEIMDEDGEIEKGSPPPSLMKVMGETKIIELVYGSRNDYVVKFVHKEDTVTKAQSSQITSTTPEKTTSKRALKIHDDQPEAQESTKKPRG